MDLASALRVVVFAGVGIAFIFALASVFVPGFMEGGAAIATVVLGFFASMGTAIAAASASQKVYDRSKRDAEKGEE